ncbi:MAG: ATP-binding protein [Hyphomicrobium sp.]|nr:ATP-binding protein [Hyphomicrobium sp.]
MVAKVGCIIFLVEAAIMLTLFSTEFSAHSLFECFLDATLLTIIASPLIYAWVARPFAEDAAAARQELTDQLTHTRALLDQNVDLRNSLQTFSEASADIHERTLQRIGADLHDGPAQALTFSQLQLDRLIRAAEKSADPTRDPQQLATFRELRQVVHDTAKEIRSISTGLSLPELRDMPLKDVVELAVHRHKLATGVSAHIDFRAPDRAPEAHKACIYRVIQEALTNSYKHGKASRADVRLSQGAGVSLEIADNGTGFDTEHGAGSGLGLLGMRARVHALRGTFEIVSAPSGGTIIRVHFPELSASVPARGPHV